MIWYALQTAWKNSHHKSCLRQRKDKAYKIDKIKV